MDTPEKEIPIESLRQEVQRKQLGPWKDFPISTPPPKSSLTASQMTPSPLRTPTDNKAIPKYTLLRTGVIECMDTLPKVTALHVNRVCAVAFGNAQARRIKDMSVNMKLVLVIIVLMDETFKQAEMIYGTLIDFYFKVCRDEKNACPMVTRSEFKDIVGLLENQVCLLFIALTTRDFFP